MSNPDTEQAHKIQLSRLSPSAREKAVTFLEKAVEFHLGGLPTEQAHPKTKNLSQLAKDDPAKGLAVFAEVELDAYAQLRHYMKGIERLQENLSEVLASGKRIYLCGCGATGRLSLAIETLWRAQAPQNMKDRVRSFMAGGDYALVRSIENFEDHPEFGARQLEEAGFEKGDLLLAVTEGGETPFVIGACERAAEEPGGLKPWFVYCNPDEILIRTADRSRRVLENPKITKLNLTVGPMAVTGSTRLQATSVQMFACGSALFAAAGLAPSPATELETLIECLRTADLESLVPFIEEENRVYANQEFCLHFSREHAISVFTDLTERSPTFSIPAVENINFKQDLERPSWTYLEVPGAQSAREAWRAILLREPRAIEWDGFADRFGGRILDGFNFSEGVASRRQDYLKGRKQNLYSIARSADGNSLEFKFANHFASFMRPPSLLTEHLFLKLLLNATSTLVMGRMGRFEGNVMLWVKSSNNKLVDRSIRYIQQMLENSGREIPPYNQIAIELFDVVETLPTDEPAVLKTFERLKG
jgi:N-acetylmuramic acid 6-phosphate etherase